MEIFFSFLLALILVFIAMPAYVRVSKAKQLYDKADHRKVHINPVPNLGGVVIFASFALSSLIFTGSTVCYQLKYMMAGVLLMLMIGMKDDLINISAKKKLLVQIAAVVLLIIPGGLRLTTAHGLFGIYEMSYIPGFLVTAVVMLGIINAYNLIDGIDGLASTVGIIAFTYFGIFFYLKDEPNFAVVSASLAGSLIAFFWFNVFGKENKSFMGDTGSLIIGFAVAAFVVRYNEMHVANGTTSIQNLAPALSFAVVIIPVFDTIRVFFVRIIAGGSPFVADKNHLHHHLLLIFKNHLMVTTAIAAINLVLIATALKLAESGIGVNALFIIIGLISLSFTITIMTISRYKQKRAQIEEAFNQAPGSILADVGVLKKQA